MNPDQGDDEDGGAREWALTHGYADHDSDGDWVALFSDGDLFRHDDVWEVFARAAVMYDQRLLTAGIAPVAVTIGPAGSLDIPTARNLEGEPSANRGWATANHLPPYVHTCISCGMAFNKKIAEECAVCGHPVGAPEPQVDNEDDWK